MDNATNYFCYPNLTGRQIVELENNRTKVLFGLYRLCYGWIPLPLAVLSLLLTLIYATAIHKAIARRRVSRKCYVFILNKAAGDLICCTFFIASSLDVLFSNPDDFNLSLFIVMISMCGSCFWSGMVSYVSLCLLKLFAVWKPLHYKMYFSMKRCICIISLSWIVFSALSIFAWTLYAVEKVRFLEALIRMRGTRSVFLLSRTRDIFLIFLYSLTIIAFILTVVFIKRGRSFIDSLQVWNKNSSRHRRRFPFWKLALGLATFVILNSPYFLGSIRDLLVYERCFWQTHRDRKTIVMATFRVFLLIRILTDAVVGFITDSQLRRSVGVLFTSAPSDISDKYQVSQSSVNGASCPTCNTNHKMSTNKMRCTVSQPYNGFDLADGISDVTVKTGHVSL